MGREKGRVSEETAHACNNDDEMLRREGNQPQQQQPDNYGPVRPYYPSDETPHRGENFDRRELDGETEVVGMTTSEAKERETPLGGGSSSSSNGKMMSPGREEEEDVTGEGKEENTSEAIDGFFDSLLAMARRAEMRGEYPRLIHKIWWQGEKDLPARYRAPLRSWYDMHGCHQEKKEKTTMTTTTTTTTTTEGKGGREREIGEGEDVEDGWHVIVWDGPRITEMMRRFHNSFLSMFLVSFRFFFFFSFLSSSISFV